MPFSSFIYLIDGLGLFTNATNLGGLGGLWDEAIFRDVFHVEFQGYPSTLLVALM